MKTTTLPETIPPAIAALIQSARDRRAAALADLDVRMAEDRREHWQRLLAAVTQAVPDEVREFLRPMDLAAAAYFSLDTECWTVVLDIPGLRPVSIGWGFGLDDGATWDCTGFAVFDDRHGSWSCLSADCIEEALLLAMEFDAAEIPF